MQWEGIDEGKVFDLHRLENGANLFFACHLCFRPMTPHNVATALGIFPDGTHANLCEYWYLMNVNALADGIVRSHLSHDPVWAGRVRKSADRLIELAHEIGYKFNDQGYRFNTRVPFTNQDMYRQPDAVGGYAYLMLFAYEMFGKCEISR